MSVFTMRFNELRKDSKKTQAQVAADLDMKPQAISYIAKGREPDFETVIKFADYFGVTTDYLLGKTPFKNDIDAEEAQEQSNDIAILLSQLRPEVRGGFLASLEGLLLKCGDGIPDSSTIILNRLSSVMGRLTEIKGAFAEWVGDAAVMDRSGNGLLEEAVANGVTTDTFKAALADACSSMREEIDGLYKDLPPIFERESRQAVVVARMNAGTGTEPRCSVKDATTDGNGD